MNQKYRVYGIVLFVFLFALPRGLHADQYEVYIRRMADYGYSLINQPADGNLYDKAVTVKNESWDGSYYYPSLAMHYQSSRGRFTFIAETEGRSYQKFSGAYISIHPGLSYSEYELDHGFLNTRGSLYYNIIPYKMGIGVGARNTRVYYDVSLFNIFPVMLTGSFNDFHNINYKEYYDGSGPSASIRYDIDFSPRIFLRIAVTGFQAEGNYRVSEYQEFNNTEYNATTFTGSTNPYFGIVWGATETASARGGDLDLSFHFNRSDYHGIVVGMRYEHVKVDWPEHVILKNRYKFYVSGSSVGFDTQMISNLQEAALHEALFSRKDRGITRYTTFFGFKVRFGELKDDRYSEPEKPSYDELPPPGPGPVDPETLKKGNRMQSRPIQDFPEAMDSDRR